jgi:uncharacterized protein with HEPN domain
MHPERGAVLELRSLLSKVQALVEAGSRDRYDSDESYRWVIHRLWIAIGNEAEVLEHRLAGDTLVWRQLHLLRNAIAHRRLPDIDENLVWRTTIMRPAPLLEHLSHIPL